MPDYFIYPPHENHHEFLNKLTDPENPEIPSIENIILIPYADDKILVKDFDYTSSSQRLTIPSGATESDKITINALMDNDSGEDDSENIIVNYEILGSNTTWTDHGSHGYPVPDSYQIYILDMTPLGVERIYGINKIYPIPADRVVKVDL